MLFVAQIRKINEGNDKKNTLCIRGCFKPAPSIICTTRRASCTAKAGYDKCRATTIAGTGYAVEGRFIFFRQFFGDRGRETIGSSAISTAQPGNIEACTKNTRSLLPGHHKYQSRVTSKSAQRA